MRPHAAGGSPKVAAAKECKTTPKVLPESCGAIFFASARPRASLGHMRDASGPRFHFLARMRKIPTHASQERKHCEFICGGTELQCFINFLPVWDRQGGNIGKHSNLARTGRPHRVTKPKTSPGKILEQKDSAILNCCVSFQNLCAQALHFPF